MAAAAMSRDWIKPILQQFSNWLYDRHTTKPNLTKLFRGHVIAFERLDAQFELKENATAEAILNCFGTAGLREHLLVAKFLSEILGIEFTAQLKSDVAERDRIDEKLRQCRKRPWDNVIVHYHGWLRQSELPFRTVRLYLSTAVAFCEVAQVKDQAWELATTKAFLQRQPGLRNNLSKFVGHCRRAYGWDVELPPRAAPAPTSDKSRKLVLELRKLTRQVERDGIEAADTKVLEKIIAKSLAFRIGDIARAADEQFVDQGGKSFFQNEQEVIPIPIELADYFSEYARRRKAHHKSCNLSLPVALQKL